MNEADQQTLPCVDKLAFDTKKFAQAEAAASTWRHGSKLKVYKCRHCSLWHLASDYEA